MQTPSHKGYSSWIFVSSIIVTIERVENLNFHILTSEGSVSYTRFQVQQSFHISRQTSRLFKIYALWIDF